MINQSETILQNISIESGTLSITPQGIINVRNFGAVGDGLHDDYSALQQCMTYCESTGMTIFIPNGIYRVSRQLIKSPGFTVPNIIGSGSAFSIIHYEGQGAALKVIGGSGSACNAFIQGIGFRGTPENFGIEVTNQCGYAIRDCRFYTQRVGLFLNNTAQGFTEYVTANNCVFDIHCEQALVYARNGGNDSFHGSGMINCLINENTGATRAKIEIGGEFSQDQNIYVYNAPLSCQTWKQTAGIPFIKNNSTRPAQNFHGHLTFENFTAVEYAIADDSADVFPIYYVGNMSELAVSARRGKMHFVASFATDVSGVFIGYQNPDKLFNGFVVAGQNTLGNLYATGGEAYKIVAVISDTSTPHQTVLEFTAFLGTVGDTKVCGPATTILNYFGGNLSKPTFSINGANQLIMACGAEYTEGRVKASITVTQIGASFRNKI